MRKEIMLASNMINPLGVLMDYAIYNNHLRKHEEIKM